MTVEDRLREAIADHVAHIPAPPDAWEDIENRGAGARRRTWVRGSGLAAVGLVGAAAAVILFVGVGDGPSSTRHVLTSPGVTTQTTLTAPPAVTAPVRPRTPTTTRTTPSSAAPAPAFAYVPLWPFRSQAEADAWRTSGNGHQPWHLDPDQTALSFTQGFLGFRELSTVVAHKVGAQDAHVSVGYDADGGPPLTAAVIHLVRFGRGTDAPWEVVGTDDTDFTITTPAYGARTSSPVGVGGRISGVDENIHVQVRQVSSEAVLGDFCCQPAGGQGSPWQITIGFSGASDPGLTIVAFTGGHRTRVERFAVAGVRR
jgi:hypothetical protein